MIHNFPKVLSHHPHQGRSEAHQPDVGPRRTPHLIHLHSIQLAYYLTFFLTLNLLEMAVGQRHMRKLCHCSADAWLQLCRRGLGGGCRAERERRGLLFVTGTRSNLLRNNCTILTKQTKARKVSCDALIKSMMWVETKLQQTKTNYNQEERETVMLEKLKQQPNKRPTKTNKKHEKYYKNFVFVRPGFRRGCSLHAISGVKLLRFLS
jgi:hypothetical protein